MEREIFEALQGSLAPEANTRMNSELTLKQMELDSNFSLAIVNVALASQAEISIRQAAVIQLRGYVGRHWSIGSAKYEPGPIPEQRLKSQVREKAFSLLTSDDRKLRNVTAAVVASMAKYDWPDEWPQLFSQLVELLHGSNKSNAHSAMCVFSEWVNADMSEQHMEQIGILLPELLRIFVGAGEYELNTRAMAVRVFSDCIEIISNMSSDRKSFADAHAPPILKEWMEPILDVFKQPVVNSESGPIIQLKAECIKSVVKAMDGFPKYMQPYIAPILETLWLQLKEIQEPFIHAFVYGDSEHSESATNMLVHCDEDGGAYSVDRYLLGVFEWLAKAAETKSMRSIFVAKAEGTANNTVPTPFFSQLVSVLMSYGQITTEMLDDWADDMDLFVADEDEEGYRFNVRVSIQELIQTFDMLFPHPLLIAFGNAARERAELAAQWRQSQNSNWWLVSEAMLWAIGLVAESVVDRHDNGTLGDQLLNLGALFESDVWPLAQSESFPFGQGRAFVFASSFAKTLPPNIASAFVDASCNAVSNTHLHPAVRLSAVRATSNFCSDLPKDVARPRQADFINGLATIIPRLSEDSAHIALDALHSALQVDQGIAASLEPVISEMAMGIWQKYPGDVLLTSIVIDIVEDMAGNSHASEAFTRHALPIIGTAITQSTDGMVVSSAIDLLTGLVKGGSSPMPEGYTDAVFPSLMHVLSTSSDSEVLQSGQACLKYFVQKDAKRISEWHDSNGVTGLEHIIRFVAVLLSPDSSESAALFVGALVVKIVQKCSAFISSDVLTELIRVVTSRLATARTSSFCSSLVPLYAQLFLRHPAELVDLLSGMSFGGQSGLYVVLSAWFRNYMDVQGYYSRKVSAVALTRLFTLGDPRIDEFVAQGDLIPNAENNGKIVTRSMSRVNPDQFTQIPASAKIIKLLLAEVGMDMESLFSRANGAGLSAVMGNSGLDGDDEDDGDDDDDDDDDDWEDDGDCNRDGHSGSTAVAKYSYLSDLIESGADFGEGDDDDEDDDVLADPIYSRDLNQTLGSFIHGVVQRNQGDFRERVAPTLTAKERDLLNRICSS